MSQMKYALLADDMRVGKTAQAISGLDLSRSRKCLIICKAIGRENWRASFTRFSTCTWNICVLGQRRNMSDLQAANCIVVSYDLLPNKEIAQALSWWALNNSFVLILDECQSVKSDAAIRTNVLTDQIEPAAERIWALSGTPMPNHPGELYRLLRWLRRVDVSYSAFVQHFCISVNTPYGLKVVGIKNADGLRRLLAPVTLRRTFEEVMPLLPKITYEPLVVEGVTPDPGVWEVYFPEYILHPQDFAPDMQAQNDKMEFIIKTMKVTPDTAAVLAAVEPQVKSWRRWIGMQKVQPVIELLRDELDRNLYPKIVVFAVHKVVLELIWMALRKEYGAEILYGGTEPQRRIKVMERFQSDPTCRVVVAQIIAAGTSVDLSAANQVLMVERDWTPTNNLQAVMRVRHMFQRLPIFVRSVAMANSADQAIERVERRKLKMITEIFDKQDPTNIPDPFSD